MCRFCDRRVVELLLWQTCGVCEVCGADQCPIPAWQIRALWHERIFCFAEEKVQLSTKFLTGLWKNVIRHLQSMEKDGNKTERRMCFYYFFTFQKQICCTWVTLFEVFVCLFQIDKTVQNKTQSTCAGNVLCNAPYQPIKYCKTRVDLLCLQLKIQEWERKKENAVKYKKGSTKISGWFVSCVLKNKLSLDSLFIFFCQTCNWGGGAFRWSRCFAHFDEILTGFWVESLIVGGLDIEPNCPPQSPGSVVLSLQNPTAKHFGHPTFWHGSPPQLHPTKATPVSSALFAWGTNWTNTFPVAILPQKNSPAQLQHALWIELGPWSQHKYCYIYLPWPPPKYCHGLP